MDKKYFAICIRYGKRDSDTIQDYLTLLNRLEIIKNRKYVCIKNSPLENDKKIAKEKFKEKMGEDSGLWRCLKKNFDDVYSRLWHTGFYDLYRLEILDEESFGKVLPLFEKLYFAKTFVYNVKDKS